MPPSAEPASALAHADVDPFAPAGVEFHPVSPRLATARLLGTGIANAVVIIAFAVPALLWNRWLWIGAGFFLLTGAWEMAIIGRQVRAMGYALAEDHLLWRKGLMFRRLSVIPYGRMQFVDTSQGPIGRHLGIAEVKLHTASAGTDATINGLPAQEAERLRKLLAERGEDRMAGL